jgi:galactitol-specific phosphotransferase system IIC component
VSVLRAVGRFAYDFVIGDDWKIAASVVTALAAGTLLLAAGLPAGAAVLLTAGLVAAAFTVAMVIDVRR